jgi:DNA-binding transcriptional MerR regulator
MEKILTSRDVCKKLGVPFYKLQYLFDTGKVQDVQRTSSGKRIYTEKDIKVIKEALFEVSAK